jgi:hypothetical protein
VNQINDPAVMFRSIESKLITMDPASRLQGAWVVTDIKQEVAELTEAFQKLDAAKVHFAILGDWSSDAHILVRSEADQIFLMTAFGIQPSTRFTFQRVRKD